MSKPITTKMLDALKTLSDASAQSPQQHTFSAFELDISGATLAALERRGLVKNLGRNSFHSALDRAGSYRLTYEGYATVKDAS